MATVTTTPRRAARGWSLAGPAGPISDDELRRWSPAQRRALALRLAALDRPATSRAGRPAVVGAAALLCLVLLGWSSQLATSLPSRYVVGHWDIAWVGFDLMLAIGIAATGLAVWRHSPAAPAISLGTAVMLLCDAWFDVATASAADLVSSVLLAGLVELPLALVATVLAHRARAAA